MYLPDSTKATKQVGLEPTTQPATESNYKHKTTLWFLNLNLKALLMEVIILKKEDKDVLCRNISFLKIL